MHFSLDGRVVTFLSDPKGAKGKLNGFVLRDFYANITVKDGIITDITPTNSISNRLILPGFFDLHTHMPQIDSIGLYGDTLLDWLERYIFPAEKQMSEFRVAQSRVERFLDELVRNGTTTAVVFSSIHFSATDELFRRAYQMGIRLIAGKVMMDSRLAPEELREDTQRSLDESLQLLETWHGKDGRLFYAFTPRFALTCSEKLMERVAELAEKYNAYIQTHLAENRVEVREVERIFKRKYTELYDSLGLLSSRTILAHCIHLDERDVDIIRQRDAVVAHCPESNMFLKSGRFNYRLFRERGVKVGLGSDIGAGTTLYMPYHAKMMAYVQGVESDRKVERVNLPSPAEMFFLLTLGPAIALGLRNLGQLRVGAEADMVIYEDLPPEILEASTEELLSKIIFLTDKYRPIATFVRGKPIFCLSYSELALQK